MIKIEEKYQGTKYKDIVKDYYKKRTFESSFSSFCLLLGVIITFFTDVSNDVAFFIIFLLSMVVGEWIQLTVRTLGGRLGESKSEQKSLEEYREHQGS